MRRTWLKHICHTGPTFSVEVCCCRVLGPLGIRAHFRIRNRKAVVFIPSSKCHKEGRINKITGILKCKIHSSLGVLYKYLCSDSKIAAADWFKQQFHPQQCRGVAATGILRGASTLPNGCGSNLNPAHFHCASMPTPGKKILLHLCS